MEITQEHHHNSNPTIMDGCCSSNLLSSKLIRELDFNSIKHLGTALQVVKDNLIEEISADAFNLTSPSTSMPSVSDDTANRKPGMIDLLASDDENYCAEVIKLVTACFSERLTLYFQKLCRKEKVVLLPRPPSSKNVSDTPAIVPAQAVVKDDEVVKGEDDNDGDDEGFEQEHDRMLLEDEADHELELEQEQGRVLVEGPQKSVFSELDIKLRHWLHILSLFPDNTVIKKRTLIYWLIGKRLATSYEEGEDYFTELVGSGLVQPYKEKHDENARGCFLTPLVRNMLTSHREKALFERFYTCLRADNKQQVVDICPIISTSDINLSPEFVFNMNAQFLTCSRRKLLSSVSSLRRTLHVLHLGSWQSFDSSSLSSVDDHIHIEVEDARFLDSFLSMEKLRYLSLQGVSNIVTLPSDSWKQQQVWRRGEDGQCVFADLRILDLRGCTNLQSISTQMITSLRNLTHLDVSDCPYLTQMPKGLSTLLELQVLKGCVVNQQGSSPVLGGGGGVLGDLKRLNKLRKLTMKLVGGVDSMDLYDMTSLRSLTITWGDIKVTKTIKFPQALEKLDLRRIPDRMTPLWLRDSTSCELNLGRLYIRGGKLESLVLNSMGSRLKVLRLRFLMELKGFWFCVEDHFPVFHLWQPTEFSPSISYVEAYKCPKLIALPFLNEDGFYKVSRSD